MWNNDLAFIKDFLIVPIDREKLKTLNIECDDVNSAAISANNNNSQDSLAVSTNNKEKDEYKNFLNKFDSLISESKIRLKHLENNSK